ncbi:Hypothetical predicted protein, partial [Paramuricea clavata]
SQVLEQVVILILNPLGLKKLSVSDAFNSMRKKVVKLYSGREEEEDQWYDARENFSDEDEEWYDANPEENLKPILTKHGIKKKVRKYVINPNGSYDTVHFLDITRDEVEALINSETEPRNVSMSLACEMVRNDPKTEEEVSVVAHFRSKTHKLIGIDDTEEPLNTMKEKMLKSFSEYQKRGSRWRLRRVDLLEIHIGEYQPLRGRGYEPLSKTIREKKAIINMKNDDEECFKWAVTRALNPTEDHPERITRILREQAEELDWEGIEFPTPLNNIKKFERNNNVGVNVFGLDGSHKVCPLRISSNTDSINLFLWKNHYSVIKDMSRLVGSQINEKKNKKHICNRCLNAFGSSELLERHLKLCSNNNYQRHEYPEPGTTTEFKNYERIQTVPFVIYADFECYIEGMDTVERNPNRSSTTQYQMHSPSGFCYYVKCFDNSIYGPKLVHYTQQHEGEDVTKEFVDMLEEEVYDIYNRFKFKEPIRMFFEDIENYERATVCYACRKEFTTKDHKVRDHCHYTGEYRGAAHNTCNLRMRRSKFIPVLFHNLEGYDAHRFIRNLGVSSGDINSLDKLVKGLGRKTKEQRELLKQKGVYPYEYIDGFDRLEETSLPPKEKFFSKLNNENISDPDYERAWNVWNTFNMKTMRNYHDVYLITDVLLLTDVMENFRKVCKTNYGLDPMWYYTASGLAWDAALKLTGVELDLISDPDMHLFIEKGIRGGISTITKRYARADNKFKRWMGKKLSNLSTVIISMLNMVITIITGTKPVVGHDDEGRSAYLSYTDANNLYGWAMSQPLPIKDFKWMDEKELGKWTDYGCILEVDLEYPDDLHDKHNEYPLAPGRITVNEPLLTVSDKRMLNKYNMIAYRISTHGHNSAICRRKQKAVTAHRLISSGDGLLKQYLSLGLKLTKIHRGVKFYEKPWMKGYIQLNTDLRTKGTTDFETDFFKLMNNSVFGKTMENVRNRVDIRLVNNEEKWNKLAQKHNYKSATTFSENLVAVHMMKTSVKLNKPIYLGMSILDISKTFMYDFHYNYIKPKYGDDARLLFTDTDSLCYEIKTEDFFKDISEDVYERFDTSNLGKDHPSGIPTGVNKKVIGMMKLETGAKQIEEFVGLRSKLYAYKMAVDGGEEKKCKGIKKVVIRKEITFEHYKECLFSGSLRESRARAADIFLSMLVGCHGLWYCRNTIVDTRTLRSFSGNRLAVSFLLGEIENFLRVSHKVLSRPA